MTAGLLLAGLSFTISGVVQQKIEVSYFANIRKKGSAEYNRR